MLQHEHYCDVIYITVSSENDVKLNIIKKEIHVTVLQGSLVINKEVMKQHSRSGTFEKMNFSYTHV